MSLVWSFPQTFSASILCTLAILYISIKWNFLLNSKEYKPKQFSLLWYGKMERIMGTGQLTSMCWIHRQPCACWASKLVPRILVMQSSGTPLLLELSGSVTWPIQCLWANMEVPNLSADLQSSPVINSLWKEMALVKLQLNFTILNSFELVQFIWMFKIGL